MIINSHAFNKKDLKKNTNISTSNNIYKKTERDARQIDYIAGANPIIIIDETQSFEGPITLNLTLSVVSVN